MLNLSAGVATLGVLVAVGGLMLQFLGLGSDILQGVVAIQAVLLGVAAIGVILGMKGRSFALGQFWQGIQGWVYRTAGMVIFIAACAELAVVMVARLTSVPAPWFHHLPSLFMCLHLSVFVWCVTLPALQGRAPPDAAPQREA